MRCSKTLPSLNASSCHLCKPPHVAKNYRYFMTVEILARGGFVAHPIRIAARIHEFTRCTPVPYRNGNTDVKGAQSACAKHSLRPYRDVSQDLRNHYGPVTAITASVCIGLYRHAAASYQQDTTIIKQYKTRT